MHHGVKWWKWLSLGVLFPAATSAVQFVKNCTGNELKPVYVQCQSVATRYFTTHHLSEQDVRLGDGQHIALVPGEDVRLTGQGQLYLYGRWYPFAWQCVPPRSGQTEFFLVRLLPPPEKVGMAPGPALPSRK